jgi:hypothetical protein
MRWRNKIAASYSKWANVSGSRIADFAQFNG